MIGNVRKKKGSSTPQEVDIVNATIKSYKANSTTISAKTFVEFVNNYSKTDIDLNGSAGTGIQIKAVSCASTSFLILFPSSASSDATLKGIVCTISGNNITKGSITTISSNSGTAQKFEATKLTDGKVFVTYTSSATNKYLRSVVLSISGTTITVGTVNSTIDTAMFGALNKPVALSSTSVFIMHSGTASTNSYQMKGIICTISGTTITAGTDTLLTTNYKRTGDIVKLSSSKVFLKCDNGASTYYLSGLVCTISGTTITAGTKTTLLSTSGTAFAGKVSYTSATKVVVMHGSNGTSGSATLNGIVCTISSTGTTITPKTDSVLCNKAGSILEHNSIAPNTTNGVRIAHSSGSGGENSGLNVLYGSVGTSSVSVTKDSYFDSQMNTGIYTSVQSYSQYPFVAYGLYDSGNYYAWAIKENTPVTTIKKSSTKIDGLTKTSATTSSAGSVWVL